MTIKEQYNVVLNCDPNWSLDEVSEPTGGSPDVLHLIKYASQGFGCHNVGARGCPFKNLFFHFKAPKSFQERIKDKIRVSFEKVMKFTLR